MDSIRLTLVQIPIVWKDKARNLSLIEEYLQSLQGTTDIAVLPEMFSTGFCMHHKELAEPLSGFTISTLKQWSFRYKIALCGSYMAKGGKACYNRGFFLTPEGKEFYYDKHHLFRMGEENANFTSGSNKSIFSYHGWNISLIICYDLRFPVWCRNMQNEYDLLICVANWPASRRTVWDTLLRARALENQSFVCGVNRIGCDEFQIAHNGGSIIYSPKGDAMASVPDDQEGTATALLQLPELRKFREKFPVWKDADSFRLLQTPQNVKNSQSITD